MVDFSYSRYGLKFREMMFATDEKVAFNSEDVCLFHCGDTCNGEEIIGLSKKIRMKKIDHQYTILTDLSIEEEELWKLMNKNYRNEVNRAKKEGIETFSVCDGDYSKLSEILDSFELMYNQMFTDKGMKNRLNRQYVEAALQSRNMVITGAKYKEQALVYHAYIADDLNALLLYSTSLLWEDKEIGKIVGWANKMLHWSDICLFKAKGIQRYEWGGIKSPNEPNGIDKFKMGFGGNITQYDNCIFALSLKGVAYLTAVKAKTKR